jgi:ABC-type multidrug transport system ATPase subunit
MKVVECENLKVEYNRGRVVAVKDLSFSVKKGDIFVFIGPDGAGKSSVFKSVCGVLRYNGGRVRTFGVDPNNEREFSKVRNKLSFMPQGLGQNLYKRLSVEENVDFFASLYGIPKEERERRKELLLKITNLWEFRNREAGKLSGGMMQKLSLVCILIHMPELLVLDEPTTGVDPLSRRDIWKFLYRFNEGGNTVLASTSYLDEAERGTELLFMKDGSALISGKYEEVVKTKGKVFIGRGGKLYEAYEELYKYTNTVRLKGKNLRFLLSEEQKNVLSDISKKYGVEFKEVKPELEDLFVEKVGLKRVHIPETFKPKVSVPEDAIVVKGVVKKFGEFTAVDRVSFTVKRGEIFGLLGPNGAGKTTLIKTILGIYPPTEGEISVAGRKIDKNTKKIIGYMSQKFSLYSDLTVLENLIYWGNVYGVEPENVRKIVRETAPFLGIEKYLNTITSSLPLGIKQRVALLSALLHSPTVLFLDEPTSGVDPAERDVFWQVIRELSVKFGVTVLITTHYMDETEYCDRVLLMNRGRAVALGSPEELKKEVEEKLGKPYLLYVENPFSAEEKLRSLGFKTVPFGRKVKIFTKKSSGLELLQSKGVNIKKIEPSTVSMEDVFVFKVKNEV